MLMGCCLTLCEVPHMGSSPQLQRQVVGKREGLHGSTASFASTLSRPLWLCLTVHCFHLPQASFLSVCSLLSHSIVSDSLQPRELQPFRLLCPRLFPDRKTGVGSHVLIQGIFPTQGSTWVSCISCIGRQIHYHLATWKAFLSVKNCHLMDTCYEPDTVLGKVGRICGVSLPSRLAWLCWRASSVPRGQDLEAARTLAVLAWTEQITTARW